MKNKTDFKPTKYFINISRKCKHGKEKTHTSILQGKLNNQF